MVIKFESDCKISLNVNFIWITMLHTEILWAYFQNHTLYRKFTHSLNIEIRLDEIYVLMRVTAFCLSARRFPLNVIFFCLFICFL